MTFQPPLAGLFVTSGPMPTPTKNLHCDVLVAGGGAAGVPCALAAARDGANVILCQDRPVLGGNASSEVRMHIVGANGTGRFDRGEELVTEAREGGIIEEIRLENAVHNPQRSASVFDLILYDLCRREPNLRLLLNTSVTGAECDGGRIEAAFAERASTEESFRIEAKVFVDCTGDGRLGAEAGASFREGREGKDEFREALAPSRPDHKRLGSTILLQARKHEIPMPFSAPPWIRSFSRNDLRLRLYATPGEEEPTHEYGYWWAEWGGTLDTIRDNEKIRDELLSIALGIWDHIKNGPGASDFQAEHWALEWIGFLPGKRESRRFIGRHILTEEDVLGSRSFDDAIAYGGWSLDLHPPEGVDAPEREPCTQHPVPHLYDIPLRACLSREFDNLLFAGRNISATHVAFSSTRVMATCAAMGQGVGIAAAEAIRLGLSPAGISESPSGVRKVQRSILRNDGFLLGRSVVASTDLVKSASITTSSMQTDAGGELVGSSQSRSTHGESGSPPERCEPGLHRWMSEPESGLPAWIQFDWKDPVEIGELRLVFDTGLHRHLTLSHHDGYTSRMRWGQAQPETVRDYRIEAKTEAASVELESVEGNYQRLRIHRWPQPVRANSLRITVTATNGIDHARICSVQIEPADTISAIPENEDPG